MGNEEICANCGRWVEKLDNGTGWCSDCSHGVVTTAQAAQNFYDKTERYLEDHADEIEFHLSKGKTMNQAIDLIHQPNGSKCLVCGNTIKRAKRTAIFCRKNSQCRRYSRRYVYLYREKGLSKSEALSMILSEFST